MNLKGGVMVVGSLLWDERPVRQKWRRECLLPAENKVPVTVRIRYGRQSVSRQNTYTMVLCNHPTTLPGQAYGLPFNQPVTDFEDLKRQAFAMAVAEGVAPEDEPALCRPHGAVGLLINPAVPDEQAEGLRAGWRSLYNAYNLDISDYQIGDEPPVINESGLLQIDWTPGMDAFDLLIATPMVPLPKRILTPPEISLCMKENRFRDYFDLNCHHEISTYQDIDIRKELDQTY
ncbi:hypothetical protein AB9P05_24265 [Roseivirga sp. BDSF3-8]|uniref:hypothetical protein n=1 Tax=Roseivirga sp. BDSF3-8 TaxID=3241598 RepID=UPI0035324E9D